MARLGEQSWELQGGEALEHLVVRPSTMWWGSHDLEQKERDCSPALPLPPELLGHTGPSFWSGEQESWIS